MERNLHASNAQGGKVFVTDVKDLENMKGDWWVQFCQKGNEHNAYTVDHFDDRSDAEEKADEVAEVMI